MDLLLILTYAAFAYGVFRIFKIPVNGFTMLTAVLGGAALIGALLLGMNYNHPYTSEARFYFNTTPIIPAVSGVVTEVPVQGNTMLKAGDVLFRIDPAPFENAVKAKEAALAAAVQTTHQLRATADAAQKKLESALADRDGAKDVFERSKKLHATGAIAQAQLERDKNNFNAAEATAQSAKSEADRALLEAEAVVQGVNTDVARLQAELDTAKFNLEQSVVRAPTDGTVQQNFLRPGMYAASMPLRPVMVFLHNENRNSRPRFCKTAPSGSSKDRRPNSFCPPCRVDFSKARWLWVALYPSRPTPTRWQPRGSGTNQGGGTHPRRDRARRRSLKISDCAGQHRPGGGLHAPHAPPGHYAEGAPPHEVVDELHFRRRPLTTGGPATLISRSHLYVK